MKYVFICTIGRSGSTLLMGLVNSIPGYHLRGEHWALGASLFQASMKVKRTAKMTQGRVTDTTHPWFGSENYSEEAFAEGARSLILNQLQPPPDARATGFKEIRWFGQEVGNINLWSYLRFLEKTFPGARFLFLTRNFDELIQSGQWPKADRTSMSDGVGVFYLLMRHAPVSNVFEIDYSDLAVGNERLMAMYDFLGEEYDEARVASVLATPHSSATNPKSRT